MTDCEYGLSDGESGGVAQGCWLEVEVQWGQFDYGGIGIGVAASEFCEEASAVVEGDGDGLGVFDEVGAGQDVAFIVPDDACSDGVASLRPRVLPDFRLLGDCYVDDGWSDDGEDFCGGQAGGVGAVRGWLRSGGGGVGVGDGVGIGVAVGLWTMTGDGVAVGVCVGDGDGVGVGSGVGVCVGDGDGVGVGSGVGVCVGTGVGVVSVDGSCEVGVSTVDALGAVVGVGVGVGVGVTGVGVCVGAGVCVGDGVRVGVCVGVGVRVGVGVSDRRTTMVATEGPT